MTENTEINRSELLLLVGLGNPGDKYKNNRHNVGFMIIDYIAKEYGFSQFKSKHMGMVSEGHIAQNKVILLKPQTYMNESGQSVKSVAKFYKLKPENIYVFHDELDLEPGKLKVKHGGGNAGHNGLKSIQAHLSSPDFYRIRVGIGHPGDKNRVHSYVLKDFSKKDMVWVSNLIDHISNNIDLLLSQQFDKFLNI